MSFLTCISWETSVWQLVEREQALDAMLLQSGKFQEALDSLLDWLTETEELVANQKPPSAEYKVTKAQMQEQKVSKLYFATKWHYQYVNWHLEMRSLS